MVLVARLRAALEKLNLELPPEAITSAIDELTRDRSAMLLEQANREVYRLLKEGIPISVPDKERGGQKTERVRVIDWEHPANNDFLLVSQFSYLCDCTIPDSTGPPTILTPCSRTFPCARIPAFSFFLCTNAG